MIDANKRFFLVPRRNRKKLLVFFKRVSDEYLVFEDWETRKCCCLSKDEIKQDYRVYALKQVGE